MYDLSISTSNMILSTLIGNDFYSSNNTRQKVYGHSIYLLKIYAKPISRKCNLLGEWT